MPATDWTSTIHLKTHWCIYNWFACSCDNQMATSYRLQYLMFLHEIKCLFSGMGSQAFLLPLSRLNPLLWKNKNTDSCDGNKQNKTKKTLTYLIHLARGRDASVVRALQINARTRLHKSPRERNIFICVKHVLPSQLWMLSFLLRHSSGAPVAPIRGCCRCTAVKKKKRLCARECDRATAACLWRLHELLPFI